MLRMLSQWGLRQQAVQQPEGSLDQLTNGCRRTGAIVSANPIVWRELGACRGLDPAMFFPDEEDESLTAKSVCDQCDVRIACLEHALASREKQGVWGGATERERRRMIRQRRRTA